MVRSEETKATKEKREQDAYSSSTSSSTGLLFLSGLKDPRLKSTSGAASARGGEGDGVLGRLDEEEAAATAFFAVAALLWRVGCA